MEKIAYFFGVIFGKKTVFFHSRYTTAFINGAEETKRKKNRRVLRPLYRRYEFWSDKIVFFSPSRARFVFLTRAHNIYIRARARAVSVFSNVYYVGCCYIVVRYMGKKTKKSRHQSGLVLTECRWV